MKIGQQVNSNVIQLVSIPSTFHIIADKVLNHQKSIVAIALVNNADGTQDFMGVGRDGLLYDLR